MNPLKRSWLSLLLVIGLLLSSVVPVLAQDDVPEIPDGANLMFIPALRNGIGIGAADEDDTAPAVTVLEVPTDEMVAAAPGAYRRALPAAVEGFKLAEPAQAENGIGLSKMSPALRNAQGRRQVVVQLTEPSVAQALNNAGVSASASLAASQLSAVEQQQAGLIAALQRMDASAQVLGTVQKALNAVIVEADAARLAQLAQSPAVRSVRAVVNYERDLSETVPYIGASAVQGQGFDGSGVKVAVLDSGIDYTHVAFGGAGTAEAYEAAYGTATTDPRNKSRDGLFPTSKVVEGIDLVGEVWPNGPEAIDDDPIDCGESAVTDLCDGGHGTHVADIIGGSGGVAPGVDLYAVKVCSAVSTSCSGLALIQAFDYILDPNGDNDFSDKMDIVNMSLGSPYGTAFDDDLSQAVENATGMGVLTVASAGNSGDKPFVAGTPSSAPTALSVAQTSVPSAVQPLMEIVAPASAAGFYPAVFQPWSAPLVSAIEAPVVYGDGLGGNLNGCAAFAPGSVAGKIVLVNRGACNFSAKISNVEAGGGVIGIIGLITPGDPFEGGFGGGTPPGIPGYMISQATANLIKDNLGAGVTIRFDPADGIPLAGHMVGSSSRGPSMRDHIIKPEIGAPGASISAVAGTGVGVEAFGGTSGAAPMVSGAAALIKQAYPSRSPQEVKAVLVNTAETNIMNTPAFFGGDKAAITRIGGGEVRVDRALAATAAAWTMNESSPAISLGFNDWSTKSIRQRVGIAVRNYAAQGKTFDISVSFRYPEDEASGAIKISAPRRVFASANGFGNFGFEVRINTPLLSDWGLDSGELGASGDTLSDFEFDGYVTLTEVGNAANTIHLPWQILPRKASDVTLKWKQSDVLVRNRGIGTATVESYSMIGVSPNQPEGGPGQNNPTPDLRYVGYATFPVPAGVCSANDSFVMAFAVNTFERQTHANAPLSLEVDIDADQDGDVDYAVYSFDGSLSGQISDGRNLTWVDNLATGGSSAFFFTDHETNSSNTVLYICGEQIGMNAANFFDPMDIAVLAVDWYNGRGVTDYVDEITISPLGEQYLGVFANGGVGLTVLANKEQDTLDIVDFGELTNNTENGLLLLYRGGAIPWVEAAALFAK